VIAVLLETKVNIALTIVTGVVAIASIAAFAAIKAARSSNQASKEAYRSRVDANAPRLLLSELEVNENARTRPLVAAGNYGQAKTYTIWGITQFGGHELGLSASLRVANEGVSTAFMRIVSQNDVEVDPLLYQHTSGNWWPCDQHDGWSLVRPGVETKTWLTWWRTANDWANATGYPDDPPSQSVRVECRDSTGTILDSCDVRFGSFMLVRHPTQDSWVIAPRDETGKVANGKLITSWSIGHVTRSYPLEISAT
jgi:hypothetical protein